MMGLAIGLIVVFALGQAQVMWAQMALSIALLLGPVFIPWLVVPQLSFLFWGWLRTVLVYSLYGAVAGAVFRVVTELGVFVVQGWTGDISADVEWAGPTGIMTAWRRSMVTIPYIVAAGAGHAEGRRADADAAVRGRQRRLRRIGGARCRRRPWHAWR